MTYKVAFEEINEAKTNLDHIYNQSDPRDYFSELEEFNYVIPDRAKPVFQKLISHLHESRDDTIQVLDVGCSYGINAALLNYDISMATLYEHWGNEKLKGRASEDVIEQDRAYFANLDENSNVSVIGLDQADRAVAYAKGVGLLEEGIVADLETQSLPCSARNDLSSVDLVLSTGCVGYVTEKSFDRLLPEVTKDQPAWIANFVLRLFPFDAIETTLEDWGYVTEKLEGKAFVQRQFSSESEQEQVLEQLSDLGVDTTGREDCGHLYSEFYLSRPEKDAVDIPIEQLF